LPDGKRGKLLVGDQEEIHVLPRNPDPALGRKPFGDIAASGALLEVVTGWPVTPRVCIGEIEAEDWWVPRRVGGRVGKLAPSRWLPLQSIHWFGHRVVRLDNENLNPRKESPCGKRETSSVCCC
jgi:hypothetical protein